MMAAAKHEIAEKVKAEAEALAEELAAMKSETKMKLSGLSVRSRRPTQSSLPATELSGGEVGDRRTPLRLVGRVRGNPQRERGAEGSRGEGGGGRARREARGARRGKTASGRARRRSATRHEMPTRRVTRRRTLRSSPRNSPRSRASKLLRRRGTLRKQSAAAEAKAAADADLAAYKEKLRRAVEKGKGIQSEKKALEEKHATLERKLALLEAEHKRLSSSREGEVGAEVAAIARAEAAERDASEQRAIAAAVANDLERVRAEMRARFDADVAAARETAEAELASARGAIERLEADTKALEEAAEADIAAAQAAEKGRHR